MPRPSLFLTKEGKDYRYIYSHGFTRLYYRGEIIASTAIRGSELDAYMAGKAYEHASRLKAEDENRNRVTALPVETILANLAEAQRQEVEFRERERLAEARLEALDVFPVD